MAFALQAHRGVIIVNFWSFIGTLMVQIMPKASRVSSSEKIISKILAIFIPRQGVGNLGGDKSENFPFI